jgi:hypothetical protein
VTEWIGMKTHLAVMKDVTDRLREAEAKLAAADRVSDSDRKARVDRCIVLQDRIAKLEAAHENACKRADMWKAKLAGVTMSCTTCIERSMHKKRIAELEAELKAANEALEGYK